MNLADIRARLAAAELPEMHAHTMAEDGPCDTVHDTEHREVATIFIDNLNDADLCAARAEFFARAPADIAYLLAEIDRLRARVTKTPDAA